jgi:hypothetical protein
MLSVSESARQLRKQGVVGLLLSNRVQIWLSCDRSHECSEKVRQAGGRGGEEVELEIDSVCGNSPRPLANLKKTCEVSEWDPLLFSRVSEKRTRKSDLVSGLLLHRETLTGAQDRRSWHSDGLEQIPGVADQGALRRQAPRWRLTWKEMENLNDAEFLTIQQKSPELRSSKKLAVDEMEEKTDGREW